jgi:hypothetical protein
MKIDLRLARPTGLEEGAWGAIEGHAIRLADALARDDRPHAVGAAKELVEAVAKVVLDARGQTAGAGDSYQAVVNAAHRALERQPGIGLANDPSIRNIAGAAKTMATELRSLRNDYGTGHGRAQIPDVGEELLATSTEAAILWSRWALRRLEFFLLGEPEILTADLRQSIFYSGSLSNRLIAANLPGLQPEQQHMIGLAVGQRAATGTFVVMDDGVSSCEASDDQVAWPSAYREGVAEGLIVGRAGYIEANEGRVSHAAGVLVPLTDAAPALTRLKERLASAPWAPHLRESETQRKAIAAARRSAELFRQPDAVEAWGDIADLLESPAE